MRIRRAYHTPPRRHTAVVRRAALWSKTAMPRVLMVALGVDWTLKARPGQRPE